MSGVWKNCQEPRFSSLRIRAFNCLLPPSKHLKNNEIFIEGRINRHGIPKDPVGVNPRYKYKDYSGTSTFIWQGFEDSGRSTKSRLLTPLLFILLNLVISIFVNECIVVGSEDYWVTYLSYLNSGNTVDSDVNSNHNKEWCKNCCYKYKDHVMYIQNCQVPA